MTLVFLKPGMNFQKGNNITNFILFLKGFFLIKLITLLQTFKKTSTSYHIYEIGYNHKIYIREELNGKKKATALSASPLAEIPDVEAR